MRQITSQLAAVWLAIFCALLGPIAARADPASQQLGWHESYNVEQEASGLKLTTTNGEIFQSVEISGASASADDQPQILQPGDSWRKSLQVDQTSRDGALFNTEFRSNFTEVWRDPGPMLGNLQMLGETGSGSRALTDLFFGANFLNDRI